MKHGLVFGPLTPRAKPAARRDLMASTCLGGGSAAWLSADGGFQYRWRPRPVRGIEFGITAALTNLIGSGLFATGLAGAIGINAFNAVVTALTYTVGFGVLAGASLLLSGAGGQRPSVRQPSDQQKSYELEDGPRTIVLGRAFVGGVFALRASTGYDTYRLLAHCQGPVSAFEEYYVKSRSVTVDADGTVSSPPYARTGGSYLRMYSKTGTTDQTAFSQLTSAFSGEWTTDHRLRGVACTVARFTSPGVTDPDFLKIWPEGYPTFGALIRGELIYDPRLDSTEGGSGAHRTDDESTWSWTDNGPLCVLWHCTAPESKGGFGLSFDQFDLEDIAATATAADVTRDSKQGADAERVSVCSGSYTTDTPREQVLAEIMQSTGCILVRLQNGKMSIRLDEDAPASTVTVKRENILDLVWGGSEIVTDANALELMFISPERQWKMAELAIGDKDWSKDAVSIAQTGKRSETLQLKFCPQPGQAQRIARRVFNKRRAMSGQITTNLAGLMTMGHVDGTVELDLLEDDYAPRVEFGAARFVDGTTVEIPLTFKPQLDEWSVDDDEVAAPVALADIEFAGDVGKPEITKTRWVKTGSTTDVLRIQFSAASGANGYEATYRSWDGSISGSRLSMTEDNTNRWAYSNADVNNGDRNLIEVRGTNSDGDVGQWSDSVDYTVSGYDTTAPAGNSVSLSDDYTSGDFTVTVAHSCPDINVSTYVIQMRTSPDNASWTSWDTVKTSTYMLPYHNYTDDHGGVAPPGGGSTTYYQYRVTVYNSTGQSTSSTDTFSITA